MQIFQGPSSVKFSILAVVIVGLLSCCVLAEDGQSVSVDLFGEPVDMVTPGYLHWNRASGDTVDPDNDARDLDNNFGEHAGRVDNPTFSSQVKNYGHGNVEAEYAFVSGDETIYWEFRTPQPGSYVITTQLWKELKAETTIVFSFRRGDQWIDLPAVAGVLEWPDYGKTVCWQVDVPAGQTTLPIRVRADVGRGMLFRILLGKMSTGNPLITPAEPTEHPSMYFRASDIPNLRKKVRSGPPKRAYQYMLRRSKVYRDRFATKGWKYTTNHAVGRALIQTALVYVITGEKIHLETALKMVDTVMSWPHAGDVQIMQTSGRRYNVLERGRQLSAIATVYDWLYHDIPEPKRRKIREFMAAEANRLYVYNEAWQGNLESGNWGPWIGAGYGMAGIVMRNEHPWARKWIDSEKKLFNLNLRLSAEDFGYFMNGFHKALDFGICLKTAMNEDLFTPNAKQLRALLDYRMTLLTPQQDGYPKFGDASAGNDPVLALCLAEYLDDPLAQWFVNRLSCATDKQVNSWAWSHMMPAAVVTMYDPSRKEQAPQTPRLSLATSFAHESNLPHGLRAITVLRSGYGNSNDVQFSIRCGDYAGWHGHPVQGGFILSAYGDHMVTDMAMGGTYGSPKSNFSKSAQAHSCILIDGQGQEKYSDDVYGRGLEAGHSGPLLHTDFVDFMSTDSALAYRKNPRLKDLDHADRHFVFVRKPNRRGYAVVLDDIQLDDKPRSYQWLVQTDTSHDVTVSGNRQVIRGKAELHIFTAAPAMVKATTKDTLKRWRTLKIAGLRSPRGLFVNVLYPKTKSMPLPEMTPLTANNATGVRVGTVENNETVLMATGDGALEYGDIVTDGRIAAVGYKAGQADWFLCTEGTYMQIGGKEVFRSDEPVTIALDSRDNGFVQASKDGTVNVAIGRRETTLNVRVGRNVIEGQSDEKRSRRGRRTKR